ncbi:MAG: LEA type 2 family protein [Pseudomonadota bacterium]|nr:LEA type 2 family protein [Pseudomonadota bacterium]
MTTIAWTRAARCLVAALCLAILSGCGGGLVRRVSEPAIRVQQLTVAADGSWSAQLRIENFSSIPMKFESVELTLDVDGTRAGTFSLRPAISVGPESADVVEAGMTPDAQVRLIVADALASGRGIAYTLQGRLGAVPEDGRLRNFDIERSSMLSPTPGLPGVLR